MKTLKPGKQLMETMTAVARSARVQLTRKEIDDEIKAARKARKALKNARRSHRR